MLTLLFKQIFVPVKAKNDHTIKKAQKQNEEITLTVKLSCQIEPDALTEVLILNPAANGCIYAEAGSDGESVIVSIKDPSLLLATNVGKLAKVLVKDEDQNTQVLLIVTIEGGAILIVIEDF